MWPLVATRIQFLFSFLGTKKPYFFNQIRDFLVDLLQKNYLASKPTKEAKIKPLSKKGGFKINSTC
jgi:hypothetical protein